MNRFRVRRALFSLSVMRSVQKAKHISVKFTVNLIRISLFVCATGEPKIDQIITVLLRTNMLVGGIAGFVLDNTIPGSREERGLAVWNSEVTEVSGRAHVYDLPFGLKRLSYYKFAKYVPFLPYYGNKEPAAVELKEARKKPGDLPSIL